MGAFFFGSAEQEFPVCFCWLTDVSVRKQASDVGIYCLKSNQSSRVSTLTKEQWFQKNSKTSVGQSWCTCLDRPQCKA